MTPETFHDPLFWYLIGIAFFTGFGVGVGVLMLKLGKRVDR